MTQPSEKEWLNSLLGGRRAEPLTMKNLPAFISENSDFEILHQEDVGIISPPTMPWLGTSLHNLVVLKLKDDSVNLLNLLPVAVEAKCKTNGDTIATKKER